MKMTLLSSAAAAMILAAGVAGAETITYQTTGSPFGSPNYSESVAWNDSDVGNHGPNPAGLFRLIGDTLGNFEAFCVELIQYIHNPQDAVINPNLLTVDIRDNLGKMFDSALGGDTMASVFNSDAKAAGMQMAIWEVVHENDSAFDLASGNFTASGSGGATGAANGFANDYLLGIVSGDASRVSMTFLGSASNQDLVTVSAVPVPAAGLLLLTALGGMAALRRRKKA